MSVCLYSAFALSLLIQYQSRMAAQRGVLESLQNLFPCGVFWHAVAIPVELGGSTSSLCLSVPDCSRQAVQGWVFLAWGLCCLFVLALCCRAHPGREAGKHQHFSDGCCYLPEALLWPFGFGIPSVLSLNWILHSRLVYAMPCLHLSHPQPFPLCFTGTALPWGVIPFFSSLLFHPHPLTGSGAWQQLCSLPKSFIGHLHPWGAAGTAERKGHLCQQHCLWSSVWKSGPLSCAPVCPLAAEYCAGGLAGHLQGSDSRALCHTIPLVFNLLG